MGINPFPIDFGPQLFICLFVYILSRKESKTLGLISLLYETWKLQDCIDDPGHKNKILTPSNPSWSHDIPNFIIGKGYINYYFNGIMHFSFLKSLPSVLKLEATHRALCHSLPAFLNSNQKSVVIPFSSSYTFISNTGWHLIIYSLTSWASLLGRSAKPTQL